MKRFFAWLRRRSRRDRTLAAILSTVTDMRARLDETERLLRRVQRDTERVKLYTGTVLGPDRALALLASGDRIYVDPRDGGCGINLLSEGRYEEDELRLFRRFLRPGVRVLDIGANYGIYSITAAPYVRPGGRVTAFEPNPHVHDLFWSSIYLNGFFDVIDLQRLAVADTNGELRFEINETSPGGAHIVSPTDDSPAHHLVIDVAVVRIDDRLDRDAIVDVVKIDVEGHEESVLRGMREVIARSPDIVIFMELFYPLFRDDDHFTGLLRLITDELRLVVNRILPGGAIREAHADALRGQTCNLILSKRPLAPAPDLTIYPIQLNAGEDARLVGETLEWVWRGEDPGERMIAHGPYVYLPKGRYRLVVDADFTGRFTCRLLENYGDPVWQAEVGPGTGYTADLILAFDCPRLEIGFWSAAAAGSRLTLRRVEFWPA